MKSHEINPDVINYMRCKSAHNVTCDCDLSSQTAVCSTQTALYPQPTGFTQYTSPHPPTALYFPELKKVKQSHYRPGQSQQVSGS